MRMVQDVRPQLPAFTCGSMSPVHFWFCLLLEMGSHYVARDRPGTYYIDQDGLKLMKIHLPLPTK